MSTTGFFFTASGCAVAPNDRVSGRLLGGVTSARCAALPSSGFGGVAGVRCAALPPSGFGGVAGVLTVAVLGTSTTCFLAGRCFLAVGVVSSRSGVFALRLGRSPGAGACAGEATAVGAWERETGAGGTSTHSDASFSTVSIRLCQSARLLQTSRRHAPAPGFLVCNAKTATRAYFSSTSSSGEGLKATYATQQRTDRLRRTGTLKTNKKRTEAATARGDTVLYNVRETTAACGARLAHLGLRTSRAQVTRRLQR